MSIFFSASRFCVTTRRMMFSKAAFQKILRAQFVNCATACTPFHSRRVVVNLWLLENCTSQACLPALPYFNLLTYFPEKLFSSGTVVKCIMFRRQLNWFLMFDVTAILRQIVKMPPLGLIWYLELKRFS